MSYIIETVRRSREPRWQRETKYSPRAELFRGFSNFHALSPARCTIHQRRNETRIPSSNSRSRGDNASGTGRSTYEQSLYSIPYTPLVSAT